MLGLLTQGPDFDLIRFRILSQVPDFSLIRFCILSHGPDFGKHLIKTVFRFLPVGKIFPQHVPDNMVKCPVCPQDMRQLMAYQFFDFGLIHTASSPD